MLIEITSVSPADVGKRKKEILLVWFSLKTNIDISIWMHSALLMFCLEKLSSRIFSRKKNSQWLIRVHAHTLRRSWAMTCKKIFFRRVREKKRRGIRWKICLSFSWLNAIVCLIRNEKNCNQLNLFQLNSKCQWKIFLVTLNFNHRFSYFKAQFNKDVSWSTRQRF